MSSSISFVKGAGRDLAYVLVLLPLSIVQFVLWVTGVSITASLLVLVVGFVVWLATAYAFRFAAAVDRRVAGWYRREEIPGLYREPSDGGLFARLRSVTTDPQTWKDFAWIVVDSIAGFVLATVAIAATGAVLGYVLMPLWWWAIADPHSQYGTLNLGIYTVTSFGWALVTTGIGLLLLPLVVLLNRGVAVGHTMLVARVLGPSERQLLHARVRELASSRSGAVEAAQEQLGRIERDLHDGAQARLVALAMELGMAEEELARNPDSARAAVRKARDGALVALSELRDLSRGLRPALLEERGLRTAIEALVQRAALPVTLTVRGEVEDAPEPIKTGAYFVVAEALTNAVKHSQATGVRVSVERNDRGLTVTVGDDGHGGANPHGSGLTGLDKRVRALDGRLAVSSPPGGPTLVGADFPCE